MKWLLLLLIPLLIGCQKESNSVNLNIPEIVGDRQYIRSDLIDFILAKSLELNVDFPECLDLPDGEYISLKKSEFNSIMRSMDSLYLQYQDESFDCDDFSAMFQTIARLGVKTDAAPILFQLSVRQVHEFAGVKAGGSHRLIVVYVEDELIVIEPQNNISIPFDRYPNKRSIKRIIP